MKRTWLHALVTLAVLLTVSAAVAHADEIAKQAPPLGEGLALSRFYSGPVGHQGTFRGKLLCLCCDLVPDASKRQACDANGHHHVLLVEDESMLHPLIAGTEEVTKQINSNELHGKSVVITGNYYPSTGVLFVNSIQAQ